MAVVGGGALAALALVGGTALATGTVAPDDEPLRGDTYDRAVAAALAHTGGGEVTETEVGDDGAAYEVEIVLADGRQVEVQLDDTFGVLGTEEDDDTDDPTR